MRCSRVQDRLMLFQNSELAGRETDDIRRHLRSCACCSAVAAEMRELERIAGYAMSTSAVAPAGLHSRVMTAICPEVSRSPAAPARRPALVPLRLRRIVYAALALFLLAGGFALGHWVANRQDSAGFVPASIPEFCPTPLMKGKKGAKMGLTVTPPQPRAGAPIDNAACPPGKGKGKGAKGIKATRG